MIATEVVNGRKGNFNEDKKKGRKLDMVWEAAEKRGISTRRGEGRGSRRYRRTISGKGMVMDLIKRGFKPTFAGPLQERAGAGVISLTSGRTGGERGMNQTTDIWRKG